MDTAVAKIMTLCRGEPGRLRSILAAPGVWTWFCALVIVVSAGAYGFTIGIWRDSTQAFYTAIKFPLLILLVAAGNGILNGMLAQVLGLGITFRESMTAVLASFAIATAILGSLSPVTLFVAFNTPPLGEAAEGSSHAFTLLMHVCLIAFAGMVANLRLFRLLRSLCGDRRLATRILCAWLAGNMFLGAQLSWIMRPFIGSPGLPVQFFRPDAFEGNFYESVLNSARRLAKPSK